MLVPIFPALVLVIPHKLDVNQTYGLYCLEIKKNLKNKLDSG